MNWRGGEKNIESSDGTTALKSHKLKVDTRKGLLIRINPISFLTPQTPSKEVHSTKYRIKNTKYLNTKNLSTKYLNIWEGNAFKDPFAISEKHGNCKSPVQVINIKDTYPSFP